MILCGFCGVATDGERSCVNCRRDPTLPYLQRGQEPEALDPAGDRRRRIAAAERELGPGATMEQIAEHLGVSPRSVTRWRAVAD